MTKLFVALMAIALLAGCAKEAYYVDHEWGLAQMASWDSMITNKDYQYAGNNPVGLEGVNAEEIMRTYNQTFAEKSAGPEIFTLGVTTDE